MSKIIHNEHDHFFRQSMSYHEVATEFLEAYLPKDILKVVRLDTLQPRKDTYVNQHLKRLQTDMLYSVEINGEPGFIYILVEHQRTSDPLMPFRLFKYMIEIMDQHLKENKDNTLPAIFPIVLFNGESAYYHTTDIFKLFKHHEDFARKVFLEPFKLVDLNEMPDEDLKNKVWASVMLTCLKHAADRKDLLTWFNIILPNFRLIEAQGGFDYIYAAFMYLFNAGEVGDIESLKQVIHEHLSPKIEEEVMTIAQKFEEIGIQKGIEIGIQNQKMIAFRLLAEDMPLEKIATISGLSLEVILALKASHSRKTAEIDGF